MKRTVPTFFTILVMVLLAVNYIAPMTDLDWTWQVRTGELIVENATPRNPDSFSYTIDGVLVHDFEWLYEVVLYYTWSAFGLAGLKFLKMLMALAPMALVAWRLHVEGVRWRGICFAIIWAICIVAGGWNLRPLFCTTICLLIVYGMLRDHCLDRKPLGLGLPIVMLLWSNLHPGVIAGQGLLLGAIAWEWINARWQLNPPLSRSSLWRFTIFCAAGFALTFVSPDPIDRLLYPFRPELKHPVQQLFVEMQPTWRVWGRLPVAISLVYLLSAFVLWMIVKRFRHFRGWELCLLGGTTLLANVAVRCMPDWTFVMLAVGVPHWGPFLVEQAKLNRKRSWLRGSLRVDAWAKAMAENPLFRPQPGWIAVTVAVFLGVTLVSPVGNALPISNHADWPVAALDFAEKNGLEGRFFANPNHGAYVGWRLKEKSKVYADTRGFFFPPVILEDSLYVPGLGPDWEIRVQRVLDEYRTDFFVLDARDEPFWQMLKPHVAETVYRDGQAVILTANQVRTGLAGVNQQQAAAK